MSWNGVLRMVVLKGYWNALGMVFLEWWCCRAFGMLLEWCSWNGGVGGFLVLLQGCSWKAPDHWGIVLTVL